MRISAASRRAAGTYGAALTAVIATIVALSGCSSSSPASAPVSSRQSTPASSPSLASPSSSAAGGDTPHSSATAGAAHDVAAITIKNFAFHVSGAVMPGATVRITNDDTTAHTVTADSGDAFDVTVDPGASARLTAPRTAGSYKFHCNFHSDMHGTLTVK